MGLFMLMTLPFFLLEESPIQCVGSLLILVRVVVSVFEGNGLKVNLNPGKTEAILYLTGEGVQEVRRLVYVSNNASLPFVVADEVKELRIVEQYEHLGCWQSRTGLMTPEFRVRSSKSLNKFYNELAPVLGSRWIDSSKKPGLISTLMTTKLLSNGQTWRPAPDNQIKILEVAMSKMIRRAERKYRAESGSTAAIPDLQLYVPFTSYLPIKTISRKKRLQYLVRFLNSAPVSLRAAVQLEAQATQPGWCGLVRDDLLWIFWKLQELGKFAGWPPPVGSANISVCGRNIVCAPKLWKRTVRELFLELAAGRFDKVELAKDPYLTGGPVQIPDPPEPIYNREYPCACGRRHVGERSCIAQYVRRGISYENEVPRGDFGKCPMCPEKY